MFLVVWACYSILLFLREGACEVQKEWHPGVPRVFNFIHRSKAVHVRVDGKGSTVMADPSMSLVNTMSETHSKTRDSYTRSAHAQNMSIDGSHDNKSKVDFQSRGWIRQNSDSNSNASNKNNTVVASRRTFLHKQALLGKSWSRVDFHNAKPMRRSHKGTLHARRGRRKCGVGVGTKKNISSRRKDTADVDVTFSRDPGFHKRRCCTSKRCRKKSMYARKRQLIIRRSESPANRLFDINKIQNKPANSFQSNGWTREGSINNTSTDNKDPQSEKKALNITKVADIFKENKSNTTAALIEKIAPAIKDAQFAKILPHTDELSKVAEINLNPFAHMTEDDLIPQAEQSAPNKWPTEAKAEAKPSSPESVIQKFLEEHEKPSNSTEPRNITYLPNNTISDLNSLIERASVISNKLRDSDIKNLENNTILMESQYTGNDEVRDKELAELLRSEDDALRRKSKSLKLKDTSLLNTRNNTLLLENTKPKKHKDESLLEKSSHMEKKKTDAGIPENSSETGKSESTVPKPGFESKNMSDTTSPTNDSNITAKSDSALREQDNDSTNTSTSIASQNAEAPASTASTSILEPSSQSLLPKKNVSVIGNKRINDTILHADVGHTDKNKTDIDEKAVMEKLADSAKNALETLSDSSENPSTPVSSNNDSKPIIPEDGSPHKNVSQHVRQRRVNATKLVINAVLDAVKKEMVNRSKNGEQINTSTASHDDTEVQRLNNSTGFVDNPNGQSSSTSIKNDTSDSTDKAKAGGDGGISQHTRQRRVNATKVTINAVLEAVRDELFNRLEEENGLKNSSGDSNRTSNVTFVPIQQKQQQQKQQELNPSPTPPPPPPPPQQQQQEQKTDDNSSITRNESFNIRNSNNSIVSNVTLSSSVKTSGSGTIQSQNSTLETAGSTNAPFKPVDVNKPAEQVVWENNINTGEPAKFKDVKLNVDPSAEALYGSQNVLAPIYENFGDFYDRNERLDYRAEPVFYRVESEGGFAHKHRDIPAKYWRG